MDELLTRVWKEPGFFLAHPNAIAAFGRECTRRGVPLVPSDKVAVQEGKTSILLIRTGERKQGVVGLYQPNLPGQQSPGLAARFMGINHRAIASYLVSLYCSLAVLTEDSLGILKGVETDKYHEHKWA